MFMLECEHIKKKWKKSQVFASRVPLSQELKQENQVLQILNTFHISDLKTLAQQQEERSQCN